MQAVVQDSYGSPDVLELADVEVPTIGDRDVLVRVAAAGVDPGIWHLMTGRPYLVRLLFGLRRPRNRVRGADLAGRVHAVGRQVTRFQPGDEVFGIGDGTFAAFTRSSEDRLVHRPSNLTSEQAAAIPTSGLAALQGLRLARLGVGQKVLVIGAAGGVGSLAVQIAKARGAEVTGVCSTSKVELVRSLGARDVLDYTREDIADGRRRWDVVLDTAGNRPIPILRRAVAPAGSLVIVGAETGGRWLGGTGRQLRALLLSPFVRQRLRVLASVPRGADLWSLAELAGTGRLMPVIDQTFALDEAAKALRHLEVGHARGKIVITV